MAELQFDGLARCVMSGSALGHEARNKRGEKILEAMLRNPSASVPAMMGDRHQAKRAYAFFSNPEVMPSDVLIGECRATAACCASHSRVLLVGDDTLLDFSTRAASTRGLGPVGNGHGVGLCMHGLLAVDPKDGRVLGVADVHTWAREFGESLNSREETSAKRRARPRESQVWGRSIRVTLPRLRECAPDTHFVAVGDRGADIYDFFVDCLDVKAGFLVRVAQDRTVQTAKSSGTDDKTVRLALKQAAREAPIVGYRTVQVQARAGRKARTAELTLRARTIELCAPQSHRSRVPALKLNLIEALETNPPAGVEPLHWILVTTEPIATEADVQARMDDYTCRPVIEDWHMGIKTGCAVEDRQFESRHAHENFLAIATIAAAHLLAIRTAARALQPVPADKVVSDVQLQVLRKLRPRLRADANARDVWRCIAELGGFMGTRKKDPGWRTLWRGFETLLAVERGFRLGLEANLQASPK